MTRYRPLVGALLLVSVAAAAQQSEAPAPSCPPPAVWSSILGQCIGSAPAEQAPPKPQQRPSPQQVEVLAAAEQASTAVLLDFTLSPLGLYGVTIGRQLVLWRVPHVPVSLGLTGRGSVLVAPTAHPLVLVPLRGTASVVFTLLPDTLDVGVDIGAGGTLAAGTALAGYDALGLEPYGRFSLGGAFVGCAGASLAYRFSSLGVHAGAEVLFGGQPTMLLLSVGLSL